MCKWQPMIKKKPHRSPACLEREDAPQFPNDGPSMTWASAVVSTSLAYMSPTVETINKFKQKSQESLDGLSIERRETIRQKS